jgi:hypothetical protein
VKPDAVQALFSVAPTVARSELAGQGDSAAADLHLVDLRPCGFERAWVRSLAADWDQAGCSVAPRADDHCGQADPGALIPDGCSEQARSPDGCWAEPTGDHSGSAAQAYCSVQADLAAADWVAQTGDHCAPVVHSDCSAPADLAPADWAAQTDGHSVSAAQGDCLAPADSALHDWAAQTGDHFARAADWADPDDCWHPAGSTVRVGKGSHPGARSLQDFRVVPGDWQQA